MENSGALLDTLLFVVVESMAHLFVFRTIAESNLEPTSKSSATPFLMVQTPPWKQTRLDALRGSPAFQRTILPRERAVEDGKSEVRDHEETAERTAEGTGLRADSGQFSNTNIPPGKDYTKMQDASNTVWRRAVDLTLGSSVYANVKATHDGIMDEWVKTRGGKLTPSDYDYLVYSAGFGWPDAIQKVGTDADFLKVQENYKEITKYF